MMDEFASKNLDTVQVIVQKDFDKAAIAAVAAAKQNWIILKSHNLLHFLTISIF